MTPGQIARWKRARYQRDDRPRWDDPDLPVYTKKGEPKPAYMLAQFCQAELECKNEFQFPVWRDDKTYFLGKGAKVARAAAVKAWKPKRLRNRHAAGVRPRKKRGSPVAV